MEHAIVPTITTLRSLPRAVVLKVWSLGQQHQHSLEPWENAHSQALTPALLSQKPLGHVVVWVADEEGVGTPF